MVRTLALAGLVTLFGVTASQAQYTDSYPPEDEYASEYPYEGYDYELLGDPEEYGHSEPDVDVGIFASLGSDGRWFFTANFGWVWRPYAAVGWRPYSQGHWVWTSHGWTWVSYEPFGWATYHYGYWQSDAGLGWVWIPGYEWSACRVQWAYCDNYISWAPLPPPGYYCPQPWTTAGVSVWFTVGANRFCDPYPTRYLVTSRYKSVYRERVAYKSPDRHYVERYTGTSIRTSTVNFKNTKWTRGEGSAAKFNAKADRVSMKTRPQKSDARAWTAPGSTSRSERSAVKTQPRKPDTRQFRTEESRRVASTRQAVKPQRDKRTMRDIVETKKGVSGKEWRMARAERRSQIQHERRTTAREERVAPRTTRDAPRSKASFQKRGDEPRKSVASEGKSDRRELNLKRGVSGGRGQGKAK